jgi:hypothetical protein
MVLLPLARFRGATGPMRASGAIAESHLEQNPHSSRQNSRPNQQIEESFLAFPKNRRNFVRQAVSPLSIVICEANQKT